MLRRNKEIIIALFIVLMSSLAQAQMICLSDLNNDGYYDGVGEKANCIQSADKWLCPLQAVNCIASSTYTEAICPAGTTLNGLQNKCVASPTCPQDSTYDSNTNLCIATTRNPASCPSGSNLDTMNNYCYAAPICQTGLFNAQYQQCLTAASCPSGTALNTALDICISGQVCKPRTISCSFVKCPSGTTINRTTGRCEAAPLCPSGTKYHPTIDACVSSPVCPEGMVLNNNLCTAQPYCSTGVYDSIIDMCVSQTSSEPTCPSGSGLDTTVDQCVASPTCSSGTYSATDDVCATATVSCPLGSQYACLDNGSGVKQCSPNACIDQSIIVPENFETDQTSYQNDGQLDSEGQCLGQFIIFNGKGRDCRPPGIQTGGHNCCSSGSGGMLEFTKYCREHEYDTNTSRDAGRCHYLGDYCAQKWLGMCVQRRKSYCCFNSKLGRIIHEQGRVQLQKFAPDGRWGTPRNPNCVGFTPEEFQMLDFSKMDLSEFYADINQTVSEQVQNRMTDAITNFMQGTQNASQ